MTDQMTARLASLDLLAEKATQGPLTVTHSKKHMYIAKVEGATNGVSDDMLIWDADYYAALHNAYPALRSAVLEAEALRAKLDWLLNELHEHEDVRDGSDGRQEPNQAMSILTAYDERFPLG